MSGDSKLTTSVVISSLRLITIFYFQAVIDTSGHLSDQAKLSQCSILLKKAPATRAAVLETVARMAERKVENCFIYKIVKFKAWKDYYLKFLAS